MSNTTTSAVELERTSEIIDLNTKMMIPHPIAQRNFIVSHGNAIAENFDWLKYDPIVVSYREGKYWIIEGQHRHYGIKNRFGDISVKVKVIYGMTLQDEIDFFLNQDKGKKVLKTADKLRVRYLAGDKQIKNLVETVNQTGWSLNNFFPEKSRYKISAFSTINKVFSELSTEQFISMLKVLGNAWNGHPDGVSREILLGMKRFYKTYWNEFDVESLTTNLSKYTPLDIKRDGRPFGNSCHTYDIPYARAILRRYNERKTGRKLDDRF